MTKTASTAWGNAGASSTRSIVSGDGYVEFRVTSLLTGMVALSHTDANQDYTSMEFALLPNSDGNLYVFESGVNRGVVSSYTTADVFRVAVEGGVVKYRKNGTLVYASAVAPTYPLLADAGLYHNGGTFSNVVISGNLSGTTTENVSWTNVVGATASGNSLTKTASTAWGNAGASSTRSIVSGDGYVEFKVTSLLTGMVALSHTDANQDYTSMQFALLPNSDGNLYVFESGVNRGVVSSYTTADVFRVGLEGGVVKYRKNGTLVYTSTVAPTYPLLVDAGLYHSGGIFSNVVISGNLSGGTPTTNINWLVTDHLGTPRMIVDQTGALANVKRHDYLPFGEELFGGTGGRNPGQGYSIPDGVRQQFTSKERDVETGLDYFINRYYSSSQGRFTSPDPIAMTSQRPSDPQRLNLYAYVRNSPLRTIDRDGLELEVRGDESAAYIASLENSTKLKLRVNKKGIVSIGGRPKKLSEDAKKIVKIIESKDRSDFVSITATANRSDVLGGIFYGGGEQTIDFADLRMESQAGSGGFTIDSSVMHETIEAIEGRNSLCTQSPDPTSFANFHSKGINAENEVRKTQGLAPRVAGSERRTSDSYGNVLITIDFTTHIETITLRGATGTIIKAEVKKKP